MGRAERRKIRRMVRTGKVADGWDPEAPGKSSADLEVQAPAVGVGWLPELATATDPPVRSTDEDEGATALPPQAAPELLEAVGIISSSRSEQEMQRRKEGQAWLVCREAGMSWAELGEVAGLTRSGAQGRFAALTANL